MYIGKGIGPCKEPYDCVECIGPDLANESVVVLAVRAVVPFKGDAILNQVCEDVIRRKFFLIGDSSAPFLLLKV